MGISCVLMLGLCAPSYSFITQEQHHHHQQDTRVPASQFPDLIHFWSTLWSCADIMNAFCLQAKQRAMEDMTPGQASTLARNERQIEKIQVHP